MIWIVAINLVVFGLFVVFFTTYQIFIHTLYRNPKKARTRKCGEENCEDQKKIFDQGVAWATDYQDSTEDLHIVNDGLNLYGQYINLGYDRCAVIVQGRTESLLYSYYYADVYVKSGYNILVIDTRAHGLSDGNYITAGVQEHKDLIRWIELIKTRYGIGSFVIHGICIGAATAVYTYCALKKENLIQKIVLDGIFTNYYEIFKNHIIERKKPVFCFVYLTFFLTYLCTGARLLKETPYKRMSEIDIPVLFMWSKKDIYCIEEKNREVFAACQSKDKEVRFFPDGGHSFVRFSHREEYDKTVLAFLKKSEAEML